MDCSIRTIRLTMWSSSIFTIGHNPLTLQTVNIGGSFFPIVPWLDVMLSFAMVTSGPYGADNRDNNVTGTFCQTLFEGAYNNPCPSCEVGVRCSEAT